MTAVMILPADMPAITANDLSMMWAVFQASRLKVLQAATADGKAGHPVIFDRSLFVQFDGLSGDRGAASIVSDNAKHHGLVPLEGDRATLDLDTPEAWEAWRASRGLSGLAALLGNQ
jgi:CTP:molybdopterin cytidylyltransferase MocA